MKYIEHLTHDASVLMVLTAALNHSTPGSPGFADLNPTYRKVFTPGELSLGLVVPLESYSTSAVPAMDRHLERAQLAESLGFSSLWLRDVPFNVPNFGDAGQVFDPFVYLGLLAGQTSSIGLGVASMVLPLRHPAHVAKAAASVDVLSNGRLLLGVAAGDRAEEYPAMGLDHAERGQRFQESYQYIRQMSEDFPRTQNIYGNTQGDIDLLPKPHSNRLPLLVTGSSQQSAEWIAANGDGWITYPRPAAVQHRLISEYREKVDQTLGIDKPVMEPLYVDLVEDANAAPRPIHLGFRSGTRSLLEYLKSRRRIGVNHVALNLRFNGRDVEETMRQLATEIIPEL